jgi:hypothetical protein
MSDHKGPTYGGASTCGKEMVFVGRAFRSDKGDSAQAQAADLQGLDVQSASQGVEQLGMDAAKPTVAHAQQVVARLSLGQHLRDDLVNVGAH